MRHYLLIIKNYTLPSPENRFNTKNIKSTKNYKFITFTKNIHSIFIWDQTRKLLNQKHTQLQINKKLIEIKEI